MNVLGVKYQTLNVTQVKQSVACNWQVSAKDDVNISGIFRELLMQARQQLDSAAAEEEDDDESRPQSPASPGAGGGGPPVFELRRRRVGSDGLQRLRAKRTSCHVS